MRRFYTPDDSKQDAIDGLVARYASGDLSQVVFEVSLRRYVDADEIRHLVMLHQLAHRNSLPFKRGEVT